MKTDYDKKCFEILGGLSDRPKMLLHCCCAPCSSYVAALLSGYFELTLLFYNPNIFPRAEYDKRKRELIRLCESELFARSPAILNCDYDDARFYAAVQGLEDCPEGGRRCDVCIGLRMEYTAKAASEKGFPWFCTTLSVSPHKNCEVINELAVGLENKYGVRFLPNDFKKRDGFLTSIKNSNRLGIYRQNYCGCEYSLKGVS